MNRVDVERFFKTLLLGDFEEQQSTPAVVISGLLGVVPILDQVLDARDITGALYRINRQGGFRNASTEQIVNFGFATFGAIPSVGSAFKGVFKPLWKERRVAKGAVSNGLAAVERLLGMRKGGAVTWIRQEILSKWPARTREAIQAANLALDSCIELTEFLATASGWKDWLVPDPIQALAKEMLPGLRSLRGKLDEPIQRASREIHALLEDLVGEQAAAVVMAAGQRAVAASAVPGTRARAGHNAADLRPRGTAPARQPTTSVGARPKADARSGAGPVHAAVQRTRKAFSDLATREKGLIGEHMVDYHELKRLGGSWPHDKAVGNWAPTSVKKLNARHRPVNLALRDLPTINQPGIDAVWEHAGRFTVVEAKASESIGALYGFGKYKERKGLIPVVPGLSGDKQMLHYVLSDSSDKGGRDTPLMQMSVRWTRDRAGREGLPSAAMRAIDAELAERRVVLVTLESRGAPDHVQALADAHLGKTEAEMHPHAEHGITKEWGHADIDALDDARRRAHAAVRTSPASEATEKPRKPTKPRKP